MKRNLWLIIGVLLIAFVGVYFLFMNEPSAEVSVPTTTQTQTQTQTETPATEETEVTNGFMTDEQISEAVSKGEPIMVEVYKDISMNDEAAKEELFTKEYDGVSYEGTLKLVEDSGTYVSSSDRMRYYYQGEMKPVQ